MRFFLTDLAMSQSSQEEEQCPISDCDFTGALRLVLDHLRQHHDFTAISSSFITNHDLIQCPKCCCCFKRLQQHYSKCSNAYGTSSHQTNADSQPLPQRNCITSRSDGEPPASCRTALSTNSFSKKKRKISKEAEAWDLISGLSIDTILRAKPPRTVQKYQLI